MRILNLRTCRLATTLMLTCGFPLVASADFQDLGTDEGVLFAGPKIADERSKHYSNGNSLTSFKQRGVVLSDDPDSPWYEAAFLSAGSTLVDADGNLVIEVATFETTDANGDITWSAIVRESEDGPAKIHTIFGYNKWKWMTGEGEIAPADDPRQDDHSKQRYSVSWTIDPDGQKVKHQTNLNPDDFDGYDSMYSFHGIHAPREIRTMANGVELVLNDQPGVWIGNVEGSPAYRSTFYTTTTEVRDPSATRGVTIHAGFGEFADSDGDIIWITGVDSYLDFGVQGTGDIIGGTGKWKGITGHVRFNGGVLEGGRGDDHNLVKWEIGYNLP